MPDAAPVMTTTRAEDSVTARTLPAHLEHVLDASSIVPDDRVPRRARRSLDRQGLSRRELEGWFKFGKGGGMTQLTIGQLAERAGVATSAIRFYEAQGLISSVRTTGNQRRYEQSTLRRIAFIRTAQRVGLSLDEIGAALATLPKDRAPTGRLDPAEPDLAAAPRRADRADRAAARPAGQLHRLRLPEPEDLRAEQPRRRGRGARPRRGVPRARTEGGPDEPAARAAPRRVAALPLRRGAGPGLGGARSGCARRRPTRSTGSGCARRTTRSRRTTPARRPGATTTRSGGRACCRCTTR